MAFKDLREFVDGRFLDLPIDGVTYRVDDVDAETGMWVQKVMDLGIAAHQGKDVDGSTLDDEQEVEAYKRILGGTYDEMAADGVAWSDIKHVATTAMIWIAFDEDTAQKFWETGDQGEAEAPAQTPGPNRHSRRASSAAVRTTRKRASTSTTKASAPTTKKVSPGRRSSASGA